MNGKIQINSSTPKKITSSIKRFVKKTGLKYKPRFLPLDQRASGFTERECFANCEIESKRTGAKIIHGWIIWEDRKRKFLEAEFHAVLLENKKLIDITPKADNEQKILFVPDRLRKAVRVDSCTWETWTAFKSLNGILIEVAKPTTRMAILQ